MPTDAAARGSVAGVLPAARRPRARPRRTPLAELVDPGGRGDRRHGWGQAAFLAAAGRAVHALVRREPPVAEQLVEELVDRAEAVGAPALLGIALCAARGARPPVEEDSAAVLADAGRAVVLVEDESLPALDRCTALVVSAAAYNTLACGSWSTSSTTGPPSWHPPARSRCMQPAVTVDRVLIRLEWATALLELGEERQALDQLHGRRAVRPRSSPTCAQDLWRLDVLACADLCRSRPGALVPRSRAPATVRRSTTGSPRSTRTAPHARGGRDVEVLPLLDALEALCLVRLGRALTRRSPGWATTVPARLVRGSRSFPAWVRAQVLAGAGRTRRWPAHREYGVAGVPRPLGRAPGGARRGRVDDRRRAAGRRARGAVPRRAARPAHRAVQPPGLRPVARRGAGAATGEAHAADRPRRLQGGQRPARACGRRRGAAAGGPGRRPATSARRPRAAARRRRVRGDARRRARPGAAPTVLEQLRSTAEAAPGCCAQAVVATDWAADRPRARGPAERRGGRRHAGPARPARRTGSTARRTWPCTTTRPCVTPRTTTSRPTAALG